LPNICLSRATVTAKFFSNNQLILEGLIRAMPQLTERNQLM